MSDNFSLPEMDFEFKVQTKGNETGKEWVGDFKYRRPTLGGRARISITRTRLNGDLENIDDAEVRQLNDALAHLRHTLTKFPQWWADSMFGMELYDGNLVSEIYNKCMDFEAEWKEKVHSGNKSDVEVGKDAHTEEFVKATQGEVTQ